VIAQYRGLVLRGCCPTYHATPLAQQAAMELTTLPILADKIEA